MGKSFQRICASAVGNFESNTSKIPQWVTANGGTYSKDITPETTHLITTKEAFERKMQAVIEARKLKTVRIVSYDWLADSLLSKSRKPLPAKAYLWENILKCEKKRNQGKKDQAKNLRTNQDETKNDQAGGSQEGELQSGKNCWENSKPTKKRKRRGPKARSRDPFDTKRRTARARSIASNHTIYEAGNVNYSATLVRPSTSPRGTREIIRLKIYETTKTPHTYATHISFTCVGPSMTNFLAPLGSSLDTAMSAFKASFKEQTGIEWDDRMNGIPPTSRKDENGNALPPHKGWFWYDSGRGSLASVFRTG
ncbi:BRCT domain protein [Aspergillus lucknowensis]|uniref:BRCT domain-containing protein n=1 Tax=Aspergillus lucknowensis TaxID=176173 RepID=A0ABR4LXJ7_9EURO